MREVGIRLKASVAGREDLTRLNTALKGTDDASKQLGAEAARLKAEMERLAQQQALIDAFKRQKAAVEESEQALKAARSQASQLGRELSAVEEPTKKQAAAFARARAEAREASDAYTAQRVKLQELRAAMQAADVSSDGLADAQRRVKAELAQAQANLKGVADWAERAAIAERSAAAGANVLAKSAEAAGGGLRATAAAAKEATGTLGGVGDTLRSVASIGVAGILGSQTTQLLRSAAETADAYDNLRARIRLVTGEGAPFESAMQGIAEIALRTNSNLETTGGLFARLAQAGKEMGLGQEAALALTESVNQAVQLSGSSATASDAAITQLVQGLQGGVLRGDEFNSVMEQAPRLAKALATGLGVTTGELRKMAEAGQLSAETVIRALQSQGEALTKEFGALPATVGRAIENLRTRWMLFIGDLNSSTGATATVAAGIDGLANNLDELAGMATRAGAVLVAALAVQGVAALRSLAVQMLATGAGAALLTKSLNDIPKTINISIAAVGFEVGFQIGDMLRENSVLARKLGVGITEFLVGVVNDLQFLKEAAAAVFTDDTVTAAFDRFKARAEEQRAIFQGLYEDAEKSPEVVRAAAAAAAAETEKLGTTATAAGAKVSAAGAAGAAGLGSTTAAAETASGALQGLLTAATAANKAVSQGGADAARQAEALVKLALAGGRAAETFRVELPEAIAKLSGPELQNFSTAMTQRLASARDEARRLGEQLQAAGQSGSKAFAQAEQAARLLDQVAAEVGARAAQALGVDLAGAGGRVSKEFAAAQDNLALLIRSMPALQASGVNAADAVARATAKMIDGAKSQAEIDAIVSRLQALGKAGQLSGAQVAGGLEQASKQAQKLRQNLEAVTPGIQSIGEAARLMGIQTKATLQDTARDFAAAWDRIKDSTEITLAEKIKAFAKFRDAAIAANGGVESSEIALQRQMLETKAGVAGLGEEFQRSMGKADAALGRTKGKVEDLGEAAVKTYRAIADALDPRLVSGTGLAGIRDSATEKRNASFGAGQPPLKSDFSIDQKSGTIGSIYTPPPDNSGDWYWTATTSRPGGEWLLTAAAGARRGAEEEEGRQLRFKLGGDPGPKGFSPFGGGRDANGGLGGKSLAELRQLALQKDLAASESIKNAAAERDARNPANPGDSRLVTTPNSRMVEVRFNFGTVTRSAWAQNETEADALLRAFEEAYRRAGGGG